MSRRIVLLPQPLGPRMQTNSPLRGRSATTKVHVANRREFIGLAGVVGFGDVPKLDDVRPGGFHRLLDMLQHAADADVVGCFRNVGCCRNVGH